MIVRSIKPEVNALQEKENTSSPPIKKMSEENQEYQELASIMQNIKTKNNILSIQSIELKSTDKDQAAKQTQLQMEGKSYFKCKQNLLSKRNSTTSDNNSSLSFINVYMNNADSPNNSNCVKVKDNIVEEDIGHKDNKDTSNRGKYTSSREASRTLSSNVSFNVCCDYLTINRKPMILLQQIFVIHNN